MTGSLLRQGNTSNVNALDGAVAGILEAYPHSRFGLAVRRRSEAASFYERNSAEFFQSASTAKIVTCAAALGVLGPEFRFTTHVYATAQPLAEGTLEGDIVLRASGDPNLSGRLDTNGKLHFTDVDHATGGLEGAQAVDRDPLLVLRGLAKQVASRGVRRILGDITVDTSIFPDAGAEAGTGVGVSSIAVNDNIVDVVVTPGTDEGDSVLFTASPQTSYVRFLNEAQTGAPDSRAAIEFREISLEGSTRVVAMRGTTPANRIQLYRYAVPEPAYFAAAAFAEALKAEGVDVNVPSRSRISPHSSEQCFLLASHHSAPLSETVKVILKVSQNLHAELLPYATGVYAGGSRGEKARSAGFACYRALLESAGLDLSQAAQGDGCGGLGWFTPRFMCDVLQYVAGQPYYREFLAALPVMGRDGTLHAVQKSSAAAGHVFAKTGTLVYEDALNDRFMLTTKALAGYVHTAAGNDVIFAAYLGNVPLSSISQFNEVGDHLGSLATAIYESC